MSTKIPWPTWSIDNALAILQQAKSRHEGMVNEPGTNKEVNTGILHALDFSIEVVKGINELTPPQPPSARLVLHTVISGLFNDVAGLLENAAGRLRDIDTWDWDRD